MAGERAFDVGENARQVCGRFGVVSLHPEGMRHLGEERARQPSDPATGDAATARSASLSLGEGATLGGVQEVVVMVAIVGPRPGGGNGH